MKNTQAICGWSDGYSAHTVLVEQLKLVPLGNGANHPLLFTLNGPKAELKGILGL